MVCRSLTGLQMIVRSRLPIGAPRMDRHAVLPAGSPAQSGVAGSVTEAPTRPTRGRPVPPRATAVLC